MWLPDQYEPARANFLNSVKISDVDKQAVVGLMNKLLATKIRKTRASKYYVYLRLIIERGWLKSYHDVDESSLYFCLSEIEHNTTLGAEAKRDYRICIKRILEHLGNQLYQIIKTTEPARYLPRFFLTPADILKIVKSPYPHLREKTIAACLFESGCRPHEFFNLKKDDLRLEVTPAKISNNGSTIQIEMEILYLKIGQEAKTGARNVPLIFSVPWLKAWMLARRTDCDYLWTEIAGDNAGEQIQYAAARKAMRKTLHECKIANWDKISLYKFRHGRHTEVSQHLTYAQHCEYAGWYQNSDMPRTYVHLNGANMVAPLLAPFGILIEKVDDERQAWIDIMRAGQRVHTNLTKNRCYRL